MGFFFTTFTNNKINLKSGTTQQHQGTTEGFLQASVGAGGHFKGIVLREVVDDFQCFVVQLQICKARGKTKV